MFDEFTQAQVDQYNALSEKGWTILNEYILQDGRAPESVAYSPNLTGPFMPQMLARGLLSGVV